MDRILLTPSGYEKLEEECARLRVERDRAAEHVRHSLELGGVAAENGEQLDARQELELIEWRLAALEQRLADAEIVAPRRDGVVEIGEAVIVLDLESDEGSSTGSSAPASPTRRRTR